MFFPNKTNINSNVKQQIGGGKADFLGNLQAGKTMVILGSDESMLNVGRGRNRQRFTHSYNAICMKRRF